MKDYPQSGIKGPNQNQRRFSDVCNALQTLSYLNKCFVIFIHAEKRQIQWISFCIVCMFMKAFSKVSRSQNLSLVLSVLQLGVLSLPVVMLYFPVTFVVEQSYMVKCNNKKHVKTGCSFFGGGLMCKHFTDEPIYIFSCLSDLKLYLIGICA